MELQNLDQQLKLAIQNHQMLVGNMNADPQNGVLQKQLHELQAHIRTLSERQKQVVQQLRKDLEIKQASVLSSNAVSSTSLFIHNQNLIKSLPQTAPLSLTTKRAPVKNAAITVAAAVLLPVKSNIPPLTMSSTNGNDPGSRTPLAPVGAGVVTANHHHNSNHHCHHHPHIQQHSPPATTAPAPTQSNDATAGGRVGLSSPIRVPQYPPPPTLNNATSRPPSSSRNNHFNGGQQRSSPAANGSVEPEETAGQVPATSTTAQECPSAVVVESSDVQGLPSSPSSLSLSAAESLTALGDVMPQPVKVVLEIDPVKNNFMAALGLITHDMVSELRTRRTERKRRTTANPQFSYGNWDCVEKKNTNNKYLSHSLPSGFKRPRGRPRLGSTTPTGSRPCTPEDFETNCGLVNGLSSPLPRHNGTTLPKELEDTCIVCRRGGDLLSCEACFESYHVRCVEEAGLDDTKIRLKLESPWICPRCLNAKDKSRSLWPKSLALVHNYILHKSAREEEKRRLQKRFSDLESERNKLEQKAKTLSEFLSSQCGRRTELVDKTKATMESIEELKKVIRVLQAS